MRRFTVNEDVFKVEPLFVMDCTHEEMRQYLNKRYKLSIEAETTQIRGQLLTFDRIPWRVIWVRYSHRTDTIVHELFHLVTRILQDRGIPIVAHHPNGECGDETGAYLFEFYFQQVIAKRRSKRKISA